MADGSSQCCRADPVTALSQPVQVPQQTQQHKLTSEVGEPADPGDGNLPLPRPLTELQGTQGKNKTGNPQINWAPAKAEHLNNCRRLSLNPSFVSNGADFHGNTVQNGHIIN